MLPIDWKIFYSDRSTFSNLDGGPEMAPCRGVQLIAQLDIAHGWKPVIGDFYIWVDRGDGLQWFGVDYVGMIDYLIDPGWKVILLGRYLTNKEYSKILKIAQEDPELPRKTGRYRQERQIDGS